MIELLNRAAGPWAEYFGPAVIQNTLFLVLVFALLHRLRHAPAGVKQVLATVALVKLLLPPFVPLKLDFLAVGSGPVLTEAVLPVVWLGPGDAAAGLPAPAEPELSLGGALLLVWAAGALTLLAASAVATIRLAWSLRHADAVSDPVADEILHFTGIRVRRSERIGMPLTLGLRPRTIFVPPLWDDWSPECRRRVLQHELAHIQRFDGLTQMLQIWVRAIYFFHPLVRILDRRLGEYREMACDDASAGFGRRERLAYSRCLVEIAESATRGPIPCEPASALLGRKRELMNRVRYQTEGRNMSTMSKTKKGAVLAAALLLILPLSLYVSGPGPEPVTAGVAPAAAAQAKDGSEPVTLTVKGSNIGVASDQAVKMLTKSKAMLNVDKDAVVKIVCEDDVTMGTLFAVQNLLIERELYRVTYAREGEKGLPLVLPSKKLQEQLSTIDPADLAVVHLAADGGVLLDGTSYPEDKLFQILAKRLQANDHLVVSITADEDALFAGFVNVLGRAKETGAQRISVGHSAP